MAAHKPPRVIEQKQAIQLFDKQITEEKLYDNRSYEKVLV